MSKPRKRLTEKQLLEGLTPYTAHADEVVELMPCEYQPVEQRLTSLERLKDSALEYLGPFEPLDDWEHSVARSDNGQSST